MMDVGNKVKQGDCGHVTATMKSDAGSGSISRVNFPDHAPRMTLLVLTSERAAASCRHAGPALSPPSCSRASPAHAAPSPTRFENRRSSNDHRPQHTPISPPSSSPRQIAIHPHRLLPLALHPLPPSPSRPAQPQEQPRRALERRAAESAVPGRRAAKAAQRRDRKSVV